MTSNIVFDFGAVLFSWRPDLLLAEQFPHRAAMPKAGGIGERLAPMPNRPHPS